MGDYRRDELSTMMDLDLNQEPLDLSDDSLLDLGFTNDQEPQLTHNGVQDRIRQLEVVYARARWRQNNQDAPRENIVNVNIVDRINEGRKGGVKRDSSHLVAQALELDMGVAKVVGDGEGFFDCNICLDTVREPILTCCGHLFCWACFYRLPYVYSTAKECPVCKGEVTDSNITPIYGNGKGDHAPEPESGSGAKVPPRPRANRVESLRQNRLTRRVSQIPVADALRRIRIGLSREPPPPPPDALLAAAGGGVAARRHRTRLIGRALSEVDVADRGPAFGFVFDSPVLDVNTETSVNEAQPTASGSRRRNREPRGRRRGPRS